MSAAMHTARDARYRIIWDALAQAHFIIDEAMDGARCALPDAEGRLRVLRFRTGRQAREWLRNCRKETAS